MPQRKEDQIREALTIQLSYTDIILIRCYLEQIDAIQKIIQELESEIRKRIAPLRNDMAIVISVPGIEDLGIPRQRISLDDMIRHLAKTGYEVLKRAPGAGG